VFGSLGWGEIAMLIVVALIIFGPDKLPAVTRDAARVLKQLREMAQGARSQLKSELGPEFADFDLDSLNPRTFVRKHLLEGEDDFGSPSRPNASSRPGGPGDPNPSSQPGSRPPGQPPPRDGGQAPYDPDAT
jgi:sec-independent protein translocase protein TatB